MELFDALNWRYAVKQFADKKLPADQVKSLVEAACLSASAYGLQPYSILIVENPAIRQQLLRYSYGQDKVVNSSHLIVFAAHTELGDVTVDRYIEKLAKLHQLPLKALADYSTYIKEDLAAKTPAELQQWAHQQAYIALGNLLTSAALMQIDSCPMTGFDNQGYDQVLKLKEKGLTSTVICPVGYRSADDEQASKPKVRFGYDEMVLEV